MGMKKVFISYSRKDFEFRKRLEKDLGGIHNLWFDEKEIIPGDKWEAKIKDAINESDAAILIISEDFLCSEFCIKESTLIFERQVKINLRIIPIIIKSCDWKKYLPWLREFHVVDPDEHFKNKNERFYKKIVNKIRQKKCSENKYSYEEKCTVIVENILKSLEERKESENQKIPDQRIKKNVAIDIHQDILIEIERNGNIYECYIYQDTKDKVIFLTDLKLGPNEKPIIDSPLSLNKIMNAVMQFDNADLKNLDEITQLDLGEFLYEQLFGQLEVSEQNKICENPITLRIITGEKWLAGLPWHLIANRRKFNYSKGWSITISCKVPETAYALPPSPRILIIAPQSSDTKVNYHINDLIDMLSCYDHRFTLGDHIELSETWEDYEQKVVKFKPQIIYYFGHCSSDRNKMSLMFVQNEDRRRVKISVSEFAFCLGQMEKRPILVYLNCSHGNSSEILKAGMLLGDIIPVVITNRTTTQTNVAQQQALIVMKSIIIKGISPHKALSLLNAEIKDLNQLSISEIRWITPIPYCQYSLWKTKPLKSTDGLTDDPHWHLRLDRGTQFGTVIGHVHQMLREKNPKSLVFVWYGKKGEGVEIFHERLWVELRECLNKNINIIRKQPDWPIHLNNYHTAFSKEIIHSFNVNRIEDIPGRIKSERSGESKKQTLVYIQHKPVLTKEIINPKSLKGYIQWWDNVFVSKLEEGQFSILSVSFIDDHPLELKNKIDEVKIEELDLENTDLYLLDEMKKIVKKDLLPFT